MHFTGYEYNTDWFKADKDAIVQKHNDLRARVANGDETLGKPEGTGQPKASNMRQLVWNDELAVVAQRYLTDFPETEVVRSLCIHYIQIG